jgi:hypothetical protein
MKTGYLSFSGSKWRVIYQGLPLCADKATRTEAEQVAAQMKVKLSDTYWNGDTGEYSFTQG